MNIFEIQRWAKEQDEEEPKFLLIIPNRAVTRGKFADKGFGFVDIDGVNGIISLMHAEKEEDWKEVVFEPIEG